jgi:hypothetical protein
MHKPRAFGRKAENERKYNCQYLQAETVARRAFHRIFPEKLACSGFDDNQ